MKINNMGQHGIGTDPKSKEKSTEQIN